MNYEIKTIKGLTTVFAKMNECNSTTIQIFVKAWSIYETKQTNWISHFLEHMFFKWWLRYKTPQIVAETIDQIWWEFNAYTSEEYASYYVKCAPDYINTALDVLWDMMVNAQFPIEELEREKWVVIQEIMMYEDLPQKLVIDKWLRFYYWDNSYGWPTIWPVENIKSFWQNHFFEHKNNLYTKDNLIIVITGSIPNQNEMEELIAKYFEQLPEKKNFPDPVFPTSRPQKNIEFFEKNTEQNHLVIWSSWYSIFDQERFAANLLWVILWWNMSSRLFQEIREKRWLCYYITAWHNSNFDDGIFMIRAWIEKERFDYWMEEIFKQIEIVANWNVSQEEFEKSLGFLKWKTQMWIETSDQMADFIWEQYLFKKQIQTLDEILKSYEKLNLSDLKKVANKLINNNLFTYYIK